MIVILQKSVYLSSKYINWYNSYFMKKMQWLSNCICDYEEGRSLLISDIMLQIFKNSFEITFLGKINGIQLIGNKKGDLLWSKIGQ